MGFVKLKAYDAKLLAVELAAVSGAYINTFQASNALCVILQWLKQSSELNLVDEDDELSPLYPAMIKFISVKLECKEYDRSFVLAVDLDTDELVAELLLVGVVVDAGDAISFVDAALNWITESAKIGETPYDAFIEGAVPVIAAPVQALLDLL